MKWWLISDETRKLVEAALQAATHEANNFKCQDWPPGKDCPGCAGDKLRAEALQRLRRDAEPVDATIAFTLPARR